MFRGKATPTYVFPAEVKEAVRERIREHIRDYDDPEGPTVRTDFRVCPPLLNKYYSLHFAHISSSGVGTIRHKINFRVVAFQTALRLSSQIFFV